MSLTTQFHISPMDHGGWKGFLVKYIWTNAFKRIINEGGPLTTHSSPLVLNNSQMSYSLLLARAKTSN